jgi:demethylmenaquinone methyltransferase / 2-methoxy-6-polyprenyl-1,4-benzoquinol methylase
MEHNRHDTDYTDFGFETVKTKLKTGLVHGLFSRVSNQYDLMNDVMSVGLHRCWKKSFVDKLALKPNMQILDLAGGTGDIAIRIASKKAYLAPCVTVCDLTYEMVCQGKEKALNAGILGIAWHIGNGELLPYADASFDRVTIAFGLRNITNKNQALAEIARVLKPGGMLYCLEFLPPEGLLKPLYDTYSFRVIPWVGEHIAKDREAYQYLVESIRQFPKPEILQSMFLSQGFSTCAYEKWTGGIVALHHAVR